MSKLLLPLGCAVLAVGLPLACTTAGAGDRPGIQAGSTTGAGGSAAGVVGVGAMGGSVPTGVGGVGVLVDAGAGTGGSGGSEVVVCDALDVSSKPVVPSVLLLVDNSSSMFEGAMPQPWDILYPALMDPVDGVVKPLESQVRFGFANFRGGTMSVPEGDPACAEITRVDYALDNHAAIDTVYAQLGTERYNPNGGNWETPTGYAIQTLATEFAAFQPDPPGPKYILLVTDGDPNTCEVLNPQCGQDQSIKAVQDAYAAGIGTFSIGIGELASGTASGCDPQAGRCGADHLQDLANAGQGLPVQAPPESYIYQQCVAGATGGGGMLQATYAAAGVAPGTATAYAATDTAELRAAISDLLVNVISCTLDMDAVVTGNASLGSVTVNGAEVGFNDPDGWMLEPNNQQVTLNGSACETFKAGDADVSIIFPCDPETGEPIAEPIH